MLEQPDIRKLMRTITAHISMLDFIAFYFLIRKILQPNQIFSIIRRILTQTKPPKRNCHGHEPNPIPTRLVLTRISCAVWYRRAMC
jgi:hypothetical protein